MKEEDAINELAGNLRSMAPVSPSPSGLPDIHTVAADLIESQAKAVEEMLKALACALELMENDELQIEGEWGLGRSLEELEREGELAPEIIRVRKILASHSKGGE